MKSGSHQRITTKWKAISADVAFMSAQFKSKSLRNGTLVSSMSGKNNHDLEKDIGILFL